MIYIEIPKKKLLNNVRRLFDKAEFKDLINENDKVDIKLHFGEKGNTTYMNPVAVRQVVDKVKECKGKLTASDIGVLASKDPVALEQACYDLVCKEINHDVFKHVHPNVNATMVIDYACEMGMGSKEYELIKL